MMAESAEEAVIREVHEEVGLHVRVLRHLAVYAVPPADAPPAGRASWVFECEVLSGNAQAGAETTAVGWFEPGRLPASLWPRHRHRLKECLKLLDQLATDAKAPPKLAAPCEVDAVCSAHGQPVILFGGQRGGEVLVSTASAQSVVAALPGALVWFWARDGRVHSVAPAALALHAHPFTEEFVPPDASPLVGENLDQALEATQRHRNPVVVALHGPDGEDGSLACLLEDRGLPFTGSGSVASAIAWNKAHAKVRVAAAGVPVLPSFTVSPGEAIPPSDLRSWLERHDALLLKPVADGSSQGLQVVRSTHDWQRAAPGLLVDYLVEPFVQDAREITVSVIDGGAGQLIAMQPVEVRTQGRLFNYRAKYLDDTEELIPSTLDAHEVMQVRHLAIQAHQAVGAFGYSRSDFLLHPSLGFRFLEINSLPGLSARSLTPKAIAYAGIGMSQFIRHQVSLGVARAVIMGACPWLCGGGMRSALK
jgi:D-alanine-D-alanine ligase